MEKERKITPKRKINRQNRKRKEMREIVLILMLIKCCSVMPSQKGHQLHPHYCLHYQQRQSINKSQDASGQARNTPIITLTEQTHTSGCVRGVSEGFFRMTLLGTNSLNIVLFWNECVCMCEQLSPSPWQIVSPYAATHFLGVIVHGREATIRDTLPE